MALIEIGSYVFIDAAMIRDLLAPDTWKTLNLREFASVMVGSVGHWMGQTPQLNRVLIYDAVGENADPSVEAWLDATDKLSDVHVRTGALAGSGRRADKSQKAVDVRLTVDALTLASRQIFEIALLVTGDGDFAPLVDALRTLGVLVVVCSPETKLSALLAREADRVILMSEDPQAYAGWRLPK